ncbi:MAG TPA: hypothetical protein VM075_03795 [Anaerolineae bacterium]|nr:hypothetical protein [Anaerolineae bacterium]
MITRDTSPIELAEMGRVLSVDDHLCSARPFDISPDSTQVAFTWNATGNWEIHVVPIAGGTPRRLTSGPGNKYYPLWSPDGERIAYLFHPDGAENFDIYLVPEEARSIQSAGSGVA